MRGLLSVRNLTYSYFSSGAPVLRDLSFDVQQTTSVAILGRSGCGKTTLMNLVLGYLLPVSGTILENGNRIAGPHADRAPVFQDDGLWPWLSTIENVTLPILMAEGSDAARARVASASEALLSCGLLQGDHKKYPRELSVGMRKRVELARLLLIRPAFILADEPFASIDSITRQTLQDLLLSVWRSTSPTILIATHDVDEALYLANHILVLPSSHSDRLLFETSNPFQGDRAATETHPAAYFGLRNEILRCIRDS